MLSIMEELRTRDPKTGAETEFKDAAYKIGMKNGWCSGAYAIADGDFIVEEDRLNKNSFCVVDRPGDLKRFFDFGNWCLGQAVIFGDLCFINQVNGWDEWLTIKRFENGQGKKYLAFESISWRRFIAEHEFDDLLSRLEKATYEQCRAVDY